MKNILALFITILLVLPLSAQITIEKLSIVQIMTGLKIQQDKANNIFVLADKAGLQKVTGQANPIEKLDSIIVESFHANWESQSKEFYQYNEKGRIFMRWVSESNQSFDNWHETIFTYNSDDKILEESSTTSNGPGSAISRRDKVNFTYSGTQMLEHTSYMRTPVLTQWIPQVKFTYSYNPSGYENEKTAYFWNSGMEQWDPQHKTFKSYDIKNNLVAMNGMQWNKNTLQWENGDFRNEYFYDAENKLISEKQFVHNPFSQQWQQRTQGEYSYTEGRISEYSLFEWNENVADWVLSSKVEVTYDANGNFTEILMGEWDDSQWIQFKLQAEYDHNVSLSEVAYYPYAFQWKLEMSNKLVSTHYSAFYQGEWIDLERTSYHYSDFTGTGISSAVESKIKLYPNPAQDQITFDLSESAGDTEVIIMDMNGKVVLQQNLNGQNNKVEVNELSKGIYLFKLIGEEVSTGKFVVE